LAIAAACGLAAAPLAGQQVADSGYDALVSRAAYRGSSPGPRLLIDEAHHNFHTMGGRYQTFAAVARSDGYRVEANSSPFSKETLNGVAILVISNAGMEGDASWSLPTKTAFSTVEIDAVETWVRAGGSLLLIADHMPAAGAAAALAQRFGVMFTNGYTSQPRPDGYPGDLFTRGSGTLLDHPISRGRETGERIDSVVTFTGQGFQVIRPGIATLLQFGDSAWSVLPVRAGVAFDSTTPEVYSGRWAHAVTVTVGSGRVAMFGEAAMFSAQLAGPRRLPMGMNNPKARSNKQLLLNTLHWLSGLID
jgi:hypothetical protein